MIQVAAELDLSSTPLTLRVSLTRGEDFVRVIDLVDVVDDVETPWAPPEDAELVLDFGDAHQWPAELTMGQALWSVDKAISDTLMDAIGFGHRCVLRYRHGDVDRVWAAGPVQLHG